MTATAHLVARVGGLERAALQHPHGQRVEVARADGEVVGDRALVGIVDGAPLDLERVGERLVGGQRHGAGDGHRGHARRARQPFDERLVEPQEVFGGPVAREVAEHLGRQHALGPIARRDALQTMETGQQQPGTRQQHDRHGHLRDHEPLLQAAASRTLAAGSGLLERAGRRRARRQGRERAEDHARQQRQAERKAQHALVERHVVDARGEPPGKRRQRVDGAPRNDQAHGAAGQREQHAFGEQLAADLPAAGAKGGAQRQLALARQRARHRQAGDVGAGDEQAPAASRRSARTASAARCGSTRRAGRRPWPGIPGPRGTRRGDRGGTGLRPWPPRRRPPPAGRRASSVRRPAAPRRCGAARRCAARRPRGTDRPTSACRRRSRPGTAESAAARRRRCAAGRSSGRSGRRCRGRRQTACASIRGSGPAPPGLPHRRRRRRRCDRASGARRARRRSWPRPRRCRRGRARRGSAGRTTSGGTPPAR